MSELENKSSEAGEVQGPQSEGEVQRPQSEGEVQRPQSEAGKIPPSSPPPLAQSSSSPPRSSTKMSDVEGNKHHPAAGTSHVPSRYAPKNVRRGLCACVVIFLLLAGITALTLWLVYRPQKPKFSVVGAAVYNLSVTPPPPASFVSASMQFTIITKNPNVRVSIFYDRLSAFVWYRGQAITPPVALPPLFHEKHSTVALSPVLGGGSPSAAVPVPVSAEVSNGLSMDVEGYGVVGLRLVLLGKLRWKAGAITTGRYGVHVRCDVLLSYKKGFVGQVPLLSSPVQCHVNI